MLALKKAIARIIFGGYPRMIPAEGEMLAISKFYLSWKETHAAIPIAVQAQTPKTRGLAVSTEYSIERYLIACQAPRDPIKLEVLANGDVYPPSASHAKLSY
jgi:hypothetical protein